MLDDFIFPVEKRPIIHNKKESGHSKIVNLNDNSLVSVVSDDYVLIRNSILIEKMTHELGDLLEVDKDGELVKTNMFSNKRYFSMSFNLKTPPIEIAEKDPISANIRIENSYDATSSLRVSMNATRLVCKNGLIADVGVYEKKQRHIGNITEEDVVNEMIESLNTSEKSFQNVIERYKKMTSILVDDDIKSRFVSSISEAPNYVQKSIASEIANTVPTNLWELYNCITFVTTHKMDRKKLSTLKTEAFLNKSMMSIVE